MRMSRIKESRGGGARNVEDRLVLVVFKGILHLKDNVALKCLEYPSDYFGTNSGKSEGVVWKKLPEGNQTFPRGAAPKESLITLGTTLGQTFQTNPEDFPLFFRLLD